MIDALIVPALILLATSKFCKPVMLVIVASAELRVPAFTVPVTVRLCRPLMLVILASAELKVPAVTVPDAVRFAVLIALATVRFIKVPTVVMFG